MVTVIKSECEAVPTYAVVGVLSAMFLPHVVCEAKEYPLPEVVPYMKDLQRDYDAKADGEADDTQALNDCFLKDGGEKYHLGYLPNGTYLVSDTIRFGNRRCWMHGESADGVVIKLQDNCPGFQDSANPKPVVLMANAWDQRTSWHSAVMFRQEVHNVTIDVGKGNAGAIGVVFMTSNQGTLENVSIRSQDGQGAYGVSLDLAWPGPALFDNVTIEGFDYGIHSTQEQYSITLRSLKLRNQNEFGIWNKGQSLFIHDLHSRQDKAVPVLWSRAGMIAVVGGDIAGHGETAISAQHSQVYLRDIEIRGYTTAVFTDAGKAAGPIVKKFTTEQPMSLFGSTSNMLNLPVKQPPHIAWGPLDGWVGPEDFGAKNDGETDATQAIQEAIDSGAHTVFLGPKAYYCVKDTLILRGNVRRFIGLGGRLVLRNNGPDKPLFRIEDGNAPAVMIERLAVRGGEGRFRPHFRHESERTLVLKNLIMSGLENSKAAEIFMQDVCGTMWNISSGAKAWIWQLNTESRNEFNLNVDNATVWLLGQKTEGGRTCFSAQNGAAVEVIGGWYYPHSPKDEVGIHIQNAEVSAFFGALRFPKAVVETQNGITRILTQDACISGMFLSH